MNLGVSRMCNISKRKASIFGNSDVKIGNFTQSKTDGFGGN